MRKWKSGCWTERFFTVLPWLISVTCFCGAFIHLSVSMSALPHRISSDPYERNVRQPIVLPWEDFQVMFADAHKPGEHIALVGPNGTGKTLMGLEMCKMIGARIAKDHRPARVTVLQYKPRDDTLDVLGEDWHLIKKWPPKYGQEHCVVWPKGKSASDAARLHRAVFLPLLDKMYVEGNQTVYIPEAAYFERGRPAGLGMSGTMEQLWGTARSLKLSVISDTQRPRMVTILMWTEPAWLVIYKLENRDDIKRVADLSGYPDEVWAIVPNLGEHECLVIRRQRHKGEQELYVTKVTLVTRNKRNQQERIK